MNSAESTVTALSAVNVFVDDLVKSETIAFPSVTIDFSSRLTSTVIQATVLENLSLIFWKLLCHNHIVTDVDYGEKK